MGSNTLALGGMEEGVWGSMPVWAISPKSPLTSHLIHLLLHFSLSFLFFSYPSLLHRLLLNSISTVFPLFSSQPLPYAFLPFSSFFPSLHLLFFLYCMSPALSLFHRILPCFKNLFMVSFSLSLSIIPLLLHDTIFPLFLSFFSFSVLLSFLFYIFPS